MRREGGSRRALPVVAVLAGVLALTGCTPSGDAAAARQAEAAADGLADDMSPPRIQDVSAAFLVSEYVHAPDVVAFSWSGRTGDQAGDGAHLVVRVHAHLDHEESGWIVTQEEGDATRCFRLTIRGWRYWDTSRVEGVACPSGAVPPQPEGVEPERLPDGADDLLVRVLSEDQGVAAARRDLRAALPSYATIDVAAWHGGLVAAVGAPAVQDCEVAVRDADGSAQVVGVDWRQAQPGEIGCRSQLVTDPAQ